jgi:hypothetical protein
MQALSRDEQIAGLHRARVMPHALHPDRCVADDPNDHRELARNLIEPHPSG